MRISSTIAVPIVSPIERIGSLRRLPTQQEQVAAQSTAKPLQAADILDLSPEALRLYAKVESSTQAESPSPANQLAPISPGGRDGDNADLESPASQTGFSGPDSNPARNASETPSASGSSDLSEEEQQQVDELAARDREVRTHEQAHLAAAGPYARGGPHYEYQRGPDGKRYAIGGSVQIDTSPVSGDPEATIRKAQVVRAAALAPAEPSDQDRRIATQASQMQAEAQRELSEQQRDEAVPEPNSSDSTPASNAGQPSSLDQARSRGLTRNPGLGRNDTSASPLFDSIEAQLQTIGGILLDANA